jgi:hypothetical protein
LHWSETPALHAQYRDQIDPILLCPNMPLLVWDMYFAPFLGGRKVPAYRPVNLPPPAVEVPTAEAAPASAGS